MPGAHHSSGLEIGVALVDLAVNFVKTSSPSFSGRNEV